MPGVELITRLGVAERHQRRNVSRVPAFGGQKFNLRFLTHGIGIRAVRLAAEEGEIIQR